MEIKLHGLINSKKMTHQLQENLTHTTQRVIFYCCRRREIHSPRHEAVFFLTAASRFRNNCRRLAWRNLTKCCYKAKAVKALLRQSRPGGPGGTLSSSTRDASSNFVDVANTTINIDSVAN